LSGIFISYRRSDNPDAVGRIYDRLVSEFGKERVFKDVDSIPLGQDFRGHLNSIVVDCGVMLVVIGPRWTDARSQAGQRRLDDPDDFVRIELEAALARDIPVVPVLVAHAPMPGASELPESLASMAFRQSIEVRPDPDFHNDAARLVTALRAIMDPAVAAAERSATVITPPAAATGTQRVRFGWILAAVMGIAAAAAMLVPTMRHLRETSPPETRLEVNTPATDQPDSFALSPDGRQIVFAASGDGASRLWLRPLATTTAQPLAGTEGATYPFWSPDGRSIGFFAGSALKRVDLGGGAPQTVAPVTSGWGGTWSAEGVILFAPSQTGPLMRVAATGGAAVAATTVKANQGGHAFPAFLPDGRRFLFVAYGSLDTEGIYLGDLSGGAPSRLTNAASKGLYLPTGWMLWNRDGALVAQRLDVAKAALTGAPVTLADGVSISNTLSSPVSVSALGLVAYRTGGSAQRQLTWFDRSGTARGSVGDPDGTLRNPRVAPDGRRVAVTRMVQGNQNIWLLDGARMSRLTFGGALDLYPTWSPDGTRIVFRSNRTGGGDLYQKLINGAGREELLPTIDSNKAPSSWSADGRFLLYMSNDPQTSGDLGVKPMVGDSTASVFLKTLFREAWGKFSPDGRWAAYQSNESGRMEIYVRPFHPPGAKDPAAASAAGQWQVSTAGGVYATWRPDGKEIFYLDPTGAMMAAPITVTGATFAAGAPVKLFPTRIYGGGVDAQQGHQYDLAPDGRFLITTVLNSAAAPITLIQNWNPETKQ
jgi:eukaryotic-like serine/threonine-protein kinase